LSCVVGDVVVVGCCLSGRMGVVLPKKRKKEEKSCVVGVFGDVVVEGVFFLGCGQRESIDARVPVVRVLVFVWHAPGAARGFFFCTWRFIYIFAPGASRCLKVALRLFVTLTEILESQNI
jgi:hypothetical protein